MRHSLVAIVIFSACASSSQERSDRGMRASDHMEAAREHAEAAQHLRWNQTAVQPADGSIASQPEVRAMPWFYYWDPVLDHERLAQAHRGAAAQIEADYEDACGNAPLAEISVSPIVRYAIGGAPVDNGAAIYISTVAGTPEQLLAAMRCHRAWMMLGRTMMDDCPLDVPGIEIVAHAVPGAIEVLITVGDPKLVPELQRRAAKDVEAAATRLDRANEGGH